MAAKLHDDTFENLTLSLLIAITASCYQLVTGMEATEVDMNVCSLLAVFRYYSPCYAFPVIVLRFLVKKKSGQLMFMHHSCNA